MPSNPALPLWPPSLPSVIGRQGVVQILEPDLSEEERQALQRSAETLRDAVARLKTQAM